MYISADEIIKTQQSQRIMPEGGFEPATLGLGDQCSTTEPQRLLVSGQSKRLFVRT